MIKISTHHDADGVASAVLLVKGKGLKEGEYNVNFPEKFGYVTDEDFCLDMRPTSPEYKGFVIDHHPGHSEDRKYKLVFGDVPATVLVYNEFKDKIPKEDAWKVSVGAMGDSQPETIPSEIWGKYPELLDETVRVYLKYGNESQMSVYPNRVFTLLSSPINAACRLSKPDIAFGVLRDARDPYDILEDKQLISFKNKLAGIRKYTLEHLGQTIQTRNFCFVQYEAEARIEGIIALKLQQQTRKTTISLNTKTMSGSIRGVLTTWLVEKMNMVGIEAGGHAAFAGLSLTSPMQIELIKSLIRKL